MMADAQEPLARRLKARALEEGFGACGICAPDAIPQAAGRLAAFVAAGWHGQMAWMAERMGWRGSPPALWPEARSVIMLAEVYTPEEDPLAVLERRDRGAISVYARGRDYHEVVKPRLKRLGRWLVAETGAEIKVFVDTAPVMEKPLAAAAGLGWQGKHTNLLGRDLGNWFFLGAIFTTLELPRDQAGEEHCGSCRACLDICPTGALPAPYRLDARRCISYLTIEHDGPVDEALRPLMGNRIYGCDDCLAVCPWNKFAAAAREARYRGSEATDAPRLSALAALDDAGFRAMFRGSPIKRSGRGRFVRNVGYAIGNSGDRALLPAARRLAEDADPIVRDAGAWAVAAAQLRRWRLARARGVRSLSGWRSMSSSQTWPAASGLPVSARAAPVSKSASGRSGASARARSASASAAAGSSWWRSVAARSAWASALPGSAGDERLERGAGGGPVLVGGGGAGAEKLAVGVGGGGLVGLGEGRGGEVRLVGGEPLAGGVGEDGGAECCRHRAVGIGAEPGEQVRGAGVGAGRGERLRLAEPGRDAAAEAGPDRGLLAGGGGVGGDGGGAVVGAADVGVGSGGGDEEGCDGEEPPHERRASDGGRAVSRPVFLTLGHGYSAAALAATLDGWRVLGTTRSAERAAAMRSAGVEPVDWADAAAVEAAIAAADGLLVSLPPDAEGDRVLARHGAALAAAPASWVGYLSTTGVYGDRQGGWVDEESPLEPLHERGRWRVAAEAAWLATGLPVEIFRLAGIYGPGRSAFDRLREGRAQRVVKPGQVFSRIHVEDIAGVLRRLDGAAGAGDRLQRRRRRAGAAGGCHRVRGRAAGPAGAAADRLRGGRALADGAELLERVEAGVEPANPRGARGRAGLAGLSRGTAGDSRG